MFAPSFARVVRSTTSVSATPAGTLCRASLCTASKPLHQRRYSSSKSSIPPSDKKKPVKELEQNAATQLQEPKADAKSHDKVTEIPLASSMSLPRVPATTHEHEVDVKFSSFFAMHRPLPFYRDAWGQPAASMEAFEALFDQAKLDDVRSIQRTKKTLSDFVQRIYASMDAQEEMQADGVFFMDEPQQPEWPATEESIRFHASQLPHFVPPPPPVAFDPFASQPKPFTAKEVNQRITEVALLSEQAEKPTTFREHVRRRRGGMLLISVKRQRKLKMKKHKYKKLMKRTRLLRRKLDRT